jgi:anti-sigma factor RsiW
MCDFSGKLIAWMDGELPEREAAIVERHLDGCAGCRSRLAAYRQASSAFDAYSDASTDWKGAAAAPEVRRGASQWMPMAVGVAAAIAAVVALLLALPRHRGEQGPVTTAATTGASTSSVPAQSKSAASVTTARSMQRVGSASRSTVEPVAAARGEVTRREHVAAAKLVHDTLPNHGSIQSAESLPARPAIKIAIPSDAMFPPGAVPEGVSFVADVMLGPDGSAERLRLEPQLVRSERTATRP